MFATREAKFSSADVRAAMAAAGITPNSETALDVLEKLRPLRDDEKVHDRMSEAQPTEYLDAELCGHEYPDAGDEIHVAGEPVDMICLASPINEDLPTRVPSDGAVHVALSEFYRDRRGRPTFAAMRDAIAEAVSVDSEREAAEQWQYGVRNIRFPRDARSSASEERAREAVIAHPDRWELVRRIPGRFPGAWNPVPGEEG